MNKDPYFIATIANKFIKSAVLMKKLPEELQLECLIIDHDSYIDCNYNFNEDIYDQNNVKIDREYIKFFFKDKNIMNVIN
jgi:hypothetical protein